MAAVDTLVSVIIPVRDGEATLARAITSVARQTHQPLEVIVIDDGSAVAVPDPSEYFPSLRIRCHRFERSRGVAAARNEGLTLATGAFVAFLDADDEWLPDKLAIQVAGLIGAPDAAFSHADALSVVDGRERGVIREVPDVRADGPDSWKILLKHGCVITSSVIARRADVVAVGGFDSRLKVAEDQDLWLRLALRGGVRHEALPLVRKHARATSLMNRNRRLVAEVTLPMIERHLARLSAKLSWDEHADILSYRRLVAGRNSYEGGNLIGGARLVLRSAHGRLRERLWYLLSASPVGRGLKRSLGLRR